MKTWLRWILLTLTIGGGFTGLAVTLQATFQSEIDVFSGIIAGLVSLLYLFVIVSGLLFAENSKRIFPLIVAFAFQIPFISSPVFTYSFSAGFRVTTGIVGGKLHL